MLGKTGCILAQILVVFGLCPSCQGERPNIVFVMFDDAGYGDFGCYGQSKFKTPNIDQLAASGIKFTQHYSGSTVCAPSRSCLMTGQHTGHTFIRGNKAVRPEGQWPLPANIKTMPELLQTAGYKCGMFGKWGLGPQGSEGDPLAQGFDRFFGYNCQREAHTYYPKHLWDNDKKVILKEGTYSQQPIIEAALKFIKDNSGDQPFFCYMPITIPHASLHVPESYIAPFRKQFSEFENVVGKYKGPNVKNPIAAFAGMMTRADEDIGRIVSLLKEVGTYENTVIVVTSDNGPHKEGGHRPEFFNSNGGLRGIKRDLYEGGIRVPLIVHWPSEIRAAQTSDRVCANWDFLPTFCELAGVDAPEMLDGISFLPDLKGQDNPESHDYLYWEFYERGGRRAARFGNHKAVQLNVNRKEPSPIQIYDLANDITESKDIASNNELLVQKAKEIFAKAHSPSDIWKFKTESK